MSLNRRLLLVPLCLLPALAAQWLLLRHIDDDRAAYPELRAPLANVPTTLGAVGSRGADRPAPAACWAAGAVCQSQPGLYAGSPAAVWDGMEHPGRDALAQQIPFADEFLYRAYAPRGGGPTVLVYVVHSRSGEDRKHHPEICVREASGKAEDLGERRVLDLGDAPDHPAQRFRFHNASGAGPAVVIYYWHYTFPPEADGGASPAQAVHRRMALTPPSVTVQVSTNAAGAELANIERSFLPALDASLRQAQLPPGTTMGCDRVPVTLVRR